MKSDKMMIGTCC